MAIDSGGGAGVSGSGAKRRRVDELDDRCEAVASDAVPVDRISALPDELRLLVLTHLPLKDAIRTGALARGWRDLWRGRWAHRASLEVHLRSRDATQRELDTLAREPRPRRRLDRFSQIVDICNLKSSELRCFLDYAAECGVEDLHVEMLQSTTASKLNFHLPLSSPALACLSLRSISVSKMYHKGARPFHALVVIRLASVSFRREAFREMIALCPSLLTLDLRCCSCNGLVFDRLPPNLRSLAIAGCDRITSLDFVRVPSLRSFHYKGRFSNLPLSIPRDATLSDLYIQLFDSEPMKEWNMDNLRKSLPTDLSSLNVLTICCRAFTGASVLPANGASAQLPNFNLHSLKELHLLMFEMKAANLSNLYLFLKTFQCPNLERLFVQPFLHCVDSEPMKEWNMDNLRKSLPTDLSSLNVLTICCRALMGASVLPANGASAQLPNFNLPGLKELHLIMFEMKAVNLANLYLFLKTFQCPNLERLFVQLSGLLAYRCNPMEGCIDQLWEEPPEDGLDNLVMVKVTNFNWCPTEVQLVSFLLRKASSLQKLLIVSRSVTPVDLPSAPEADLLLLKEALVNGKIMLTKSDYCSNSTIS